MGDETTTRRAAERFSRPPNDRSIRLCACVHEDDAVVLAALSFDGFLVTTCAAKELATTASTRGAEVLLVDADVPDTLAAVARIRRSDSVLSTLPIVLVGIPGASLRTGLDAVEAGGDAFFPRPIDAGDLAARLRSLVELPASDSGAGRPSVLPEPELRESTAIRIPSTPPPSGSRSRLQSEPPLPASIAPPMGVLDSRPPPAPPALSPGLTEVLRAAVQRVGGDGELLLPTLEDDAVDELVPSELLEPLEAPADALGEDALAVGTQSTPAGWSGGQPARRSSRTMMAVSPSSSRATSAGTPSITPLSINGDARLTGALGRFGAGALLGAASRVRATGLLVLRSGPDSEFSLSLTSGHLLAIASRRAGDEVGPLLARLGAIPREAARFAMVPLDAGIRAAAPLAARGYLAADALALALGSAARELVFDLLSLPELSWEMNSLETATEIPLAPRALDALLLLAARARIEPEDAFAALGGDEATLSLRADASIPKALQLLGQEREAIELARGGARSSSVKGAFGVGVFPAILALAWLGMLRVEGPASAMSEPEPAIADERARVRALVEAAQRRDLFALLGVSEWSTRASAREVLAARRAEVDGLAQRHPHADFSVVHAAMTELATLVDDAESWKRFVDALRTRS
ncbi:MAG: response regulator transcription factor [Myxococcales bacterium]|nr:response regulator transcription factor [Myxococcales bacterium]